VDILSSTDIKCQLIKLKEPTLAQYKPKPIDTFDCHKKTHATANINFGTDIADLIRYIFNICIRFTFD